MSFLTYVNFSKNEHEISPILQLKCVDRNIQQILSMAGQQPNCSRYREYFSSICRLYFFLNCIQDYLFYNKVKYIKQLR